MATGLIQAYVYVRHLGDLLSTGYGRAVLAKFLLLLVRDRLRRLQPPPLGAAAGADRRAGRDARPRRRPPAAGAARRGGAARSSSSASPRRSPATRRRSPPRRGPFSVTTTLGPTQLEIDVDPARVGANQIHLYLFDAKTGAQYAKGKELTVDGDAAGQGHRPAAAERPEPPAPATTSSPTPCSTPPATGSSTSPSASPNSTSSKRIEVEVRRSALDAPSLFYLLPALLLLGAAAARPLPGRAAAARRRAAPRPAAALGAAAPPRATAPRPPRLPRGGALLGAALAGRAPPPSARADRRYRGTRRRPTVNFRTKGAHEMRRIAIPAGAARAGAGSCPAAAQAHVSLHPNEVPTGAFATLDIRVPNESDNANTTKVAVQVPPGFADVSPEASAGLDGEDVDHEAGEADPDRRRPDHRRGQGDRLDRAGGKMPPGQFQDFPISTRSPARPGKS